VSDAKPIAVSGRKTPTNGIARIWTWQPDGDLIGTVVYVHGMFDNVNTAWKGTLGSFTKNVRYKKPDGKPLQAQFEESGVKALFIVPEAEINSDNGSEVVWDDLGALLTTAGAKGPVVALSHSAGYATVYRWLKHKDLMHISLIDSMWGYRDAYAKWLEKDGHSIDLIGAGPTPRGFFKEMVKKWPNDKVEDATPPVKLSDASALQAKVLWMQDPYDHMDLIADGKLIPVLLKRGEAALLRAAGKPAPAPQQAQKPAPAVFEAGSSDDDSHHVVGHGLQSELKDVPDLAEMAALHHIVLKPGTTRSEAVKAVQKALNKCADCKLQESGKYDSDTGKAVHDFQTRWNDQGKDPQLDPDSRVGAHTLLALDQTMLDAPSAQAAPAAAPQAQPAAVQGPITAGHYPLETDGAQRIATSLGNFYRFKKADVLANQSRRPAFWRPGDSMIEYKGPGSDPVAAGSEKYTKSHRLIHPVLVEPLTRMISAMIEEGNRIDDESMKRPSIGSGWRSFEEDGKGFLKQLNKQIGKHKDIFGDLTFPAAMEKEAQSNLYGKEDDFVRHLAAQPGWDMNLAQKLYNKAKGAKAPGGLSTHESGLTVDIDFPYATANKNAKFHQITTENNDDARRSAAGMWLVQYAKSEFHFSSYNTEIEIWHMEWLDWKGTAADPGKESHKA
jgi:hypothetical protein